MSVRLFVGNLPFDVTEEELRDLFSSIGRLSQVFLPVDRESGRKRGFAFVEFDSDENAGEAIHRFNDMNFKGRPLALSEARARGRRSAPASAGRPPAPLQPSDGSDGYTDFPADTRNRKERRIRNFDSDAKAKRSWKQGPRMKVEGKRKGSKGRYSGRVFGLSADDFYDDQYDYDSE